MSAPPDDLRPALTAALDAGDLERALALLGTALDGEHPSDRRHALLLVRARLLMALDHSRDALADASRALALAQSPAECGAALLVRAEAALALDDLANARDDLQGAIALHLEPTERVASLHALGRIERRRGDLSRALSLLSDALEGAGRADPLHTDIAIDLAGALRDDGRPANALMLLERLLADVEGTRRGRILAEIATSWAFLNDHTRALAAWDASLPLLPDGPERARHRYNRAVALRELGDLAAAQAELEQLQTDGVEPRVRFDALLLLGSARRESGDPSAALDALRSALEAAPDDDALGRARLELGATLASTGLFGLALDELSAAAGLCADPAERGRALRLRGMARRELGQQAVAVDDLLAAAAFPSLPAERARALLAAAGLLLALDRRREALEAADGALAGVDDPAVLLPLLVQRGALRAELGSLDAAILDLHQAARLAEAAGEQELLAGVLADLGALHSATGDESSARAAFERAAGIAVSGPVAWQALINLGSLLVSCGERFEALDVFERAAAAAEDDRDARARAFLARGHAALRLEQYGQAEADFARVLTLQAAHDLAGQAGVGLRTTRGQLESLRAARERLTRAIAAADSPAYRAQPTLQRGLLALAAGDTDAGLIDLTRAARLFALADERALAFAHLALACAQLGRHDEAQAALADADALAPTRPWLTQLGADPRWHLLTPPATQRVPRPPLRGEGDCGLGDCG